MNSNYFTIHKNKKPKKAKYSKPYSKLKLQKIKECTQYFLQQSELLKTKKSFYSGGFTISANVSWRINKPKLSIQPRLNKYAQCLN